MLSYETKNRVAYKFLITLTPVKGESGRISSVRLTLAVTAPALSSGGILLSLRNEIDNTPCNRYGDGSFSGQDDDGKLHLIREEDRIPGRQTWSVQRATHGEIKIDV